MIKLKTLLTEISNALNPALSFDVMRQFKSVVGYHASESPDFIPNDALPLHIGSKQQSLALINNMNRAYGKKPYYLYQMTADISSLSPILYDEDPKDEIKSGKYDSYAYTNRIEYPQGIRQGDNISIVLTKPSKQITSIKKL